MIELRDRAADFETGARDGQLGVEAFVFRAQTRRQIQFAKPECFGVQRVRVGGKALSLQRQCFHAARLVKPGPCGLGIGGHALALKRQRCFGSDKFGVGGCHARSVARIRGQWNSDGDADRIVVMLAEGWPFTAYAKRQFRRITTFGAGLRQLCLACRYSG